MKNLFSYKDLSFFNQSQLFLWICVLASGIMLSSSSVSAAEKLYDAAGKRDPFVPLYASATGSAAGLASVESLEEILVEGIIYDPKSGSYAVMNGSVLKLGETSGSVKVLEIKPDRVLVSVNGTEGYKLLNGQESQ